MGLFTIRNTMLEECIYDFKYNLTENDEFDSGDLNKDFNQIFSNGIDKIKNDESATPEEKKIDHSYRKIYGTYLVRKEIYTIRS